MNIFIIVANLLIAVVSGWFFRISWKNYKEEGVILTRYWFNTIPATVTQPFCFAVFCIFIAIMSSLITIL